jgi:REP element-mobilizing transposase RayT
LYFVTICAHREFIEFAKGNAFGVGARPASPLRAIASPQIAQRGATQVSPVRELIEERMRITAEKCPFMKWEAAVIMPDHMHALIRMQGGHQRLGDIIGGFKAAVTGELRRRGGDTHPAPPKHIRIWHRNYHEMIVRKPEAAQNIAEYIRMIGNPALLNREKIGMLDRLVGSESQM